MTDTPEPTSARVYFVPDDARVVRYAAVVAMMTEGYTGRAVAAHFGVSASTITRVLQRTDIRYTKLWRGPSEDTSG